MVWTYYAPGFRPLDTVRFLLSDTNAGDQLLQDEEIEWLISEHVSVEHAATAGAETIARKFARLADESYQGYSVRYNQRATFYWQLAKDLRMQYRAVPPFVGGISVASKDVNNANTDRVMPRFRIGQFDEGDPRPEDRR